MMITKETFVKLITMIMNTIDHKREFIEDNDYIPDECKDCILEECDFLKDLITMLTCIMIDRLGVIRDYLYERDENGEYFFGIPRATNSKFICRLHRKICTNTLLRKVRGSV